MLTDKTFDRVIPAVTFLLGLGLWEGLVRYNHVPIYILPPPSLVLYTLYQDWPTLSGSLWVTLTIMGEALFMSVSRDRSRWPSCFRSRGSPNALSIRLPSRFR